MQPTSPLLLGTRESDPNLELLRRAGWSVNTIAGTYCMAWRGRDEVVFQWQGEAWRRVGGRGAGDEL